MSTTDSSSDSQQRKKEMLNPFDVGEDQILDRVYMTHYHSVEKHDVGSLHNVASDIINHSIENSEHIRMRSTHHFNEDTTSFSRFPLLKRIACQMICTARGEQYAHKTTMLILEQLKAYSWEAKAVITQAAFAMEYGPLWHLPQGPRDQLGHSLAQLNGLRSIEANAQHLVSFSKMVKRAMQMVECITEWKKLTAAGYDTEDMPSLPSTLQEIPVVVYWAIMTFVTCASHINFIGEKGYRIEFSKFDGKPNEIFEKFKNNLDECNKQRGAAEDYTRRKIIVKRTGKDIVRVLKALIITRDSHNSKQIVYNGYTGQQVQIEEFKKKHVLLFISGLDIENIKNEIQLLESINDKLKKGPQEVEDYRKEDFKILWLPIVDNWNEQHNKTLEKTRIGWYVVKHFDFSTGIKLVREVFKYDGTPIIPLLNPQGTIINPDAKQILSEWGIDGFPFRESDRIRLNEQWNWFWAKTSKFPKMKEWVEESTKRNQMEEDSYIFIFGGTDEWLRKFREAMEELKRKLTSKLKDNDETKYIEIKTYPLKKDDPMTNVTHFWIEIESLLASRKQMKGGEEGPADSATAHIKRLIALKHDPQGWVVLSKGSNVKLLGEGEAMLSTVVDFDKWTDNVSKEVSFDVAFKQHYESKVQEVAHKCAYCDYDNYPTDVLGRISCPNMKCGRVMEAYVNYKCCHGRET